MQAGCSGTGVHMPAKRIWCTHIHTAAKQNQFDFLGFGAGIYHGPHSFLPYQCVCFVVPALHACTVWSAVCRGCRFMQESQGSRDQSLVDCSRGACACLVMSLMSVFFHLYVQKLRRCICCLHVNERLSL